MIRTLLSRRQFWFLLFAAYVLVIAALRLASRETVIGDDAESFLWARSLAWGYGPQPPLYAWLHWAVMQVTGPTVLASTATRAIAQFLVPCGLFLLTLRFAPVPLAGAATLAAFLVPEVGLVFPLTRTHNILAAALTPVVALAFLVWLERQRPQFALLFGVAAALAILAKATAAVVVVALPLAALLASETRLRMRWGQLALGLAAMAVILLPPGLWLLENAKVGTASLAKFKPGTGAIDGLLSLGDQMLDLWGPIGFLMAVAWALTGGPSPLPSGFRLLWRMGAVALSMIVIGIIVTNSGDIREHWLVAIFLPIVPVTVAVLLQRKGRWRWLLPAVGGLVAFVGTAKLPSELGRRGLNTLDHLRPAAGAIARYQPDLVLASRNASANLVSLNPDLPVQERNDAFPPPCQGTIALMTVQGNYDWSYPLSFDAFVRTLGACDVQTLAYFQGTPGETSEVVSYAVVRLTPTAVK